MLTHPVSLIAFTLITLVGCGSSPAAQNRPPLEDDPAQNEPVRKLSDEIPKCGSGVHGAIQSRVTWKGEVSRLYVSGNYAASAPFVAYVGITPESLLFVSTPSGRQAIDARAASTLLDGPAEKRGPFHALVTFTGSVLRYQQADGNAGLSGMAREVTLLAPDGMQLLNPPLCADSDDTESGDGPTLDETARLDPAVAPSDELWSILLDTGATGATRKLRVYWRTARIFEARPEGAVTLQVTDLVGRTLRVRRTRATVGMDIPEAIATEIEAL